MRLVAATVLPVCPVNVVGVLTAAVEIDVRLTTSIVLLLLLLLYSVVAVGRYIVPDPGQKLFRNFSRGLSLASCGTAHITCTVLINHSINENF